ncbi:hypothetical protein ACQKWADRAFT_115192 [Trichoderma austrokoningii]
MSQIKARTCRPAWGQSKVSATLAPGIFCMAPQVLSTWLPPWLRQPLSPSDSRSLGTCLEEVHIVESAAFHLFLFLLLFLFPTRKPERVAKLLAKRASSFTLGYKKVILSRPGP